MRERAGLHGQGAVNTIPDPRVQAISRHILLHLFLWRLAAAFPDLEKIYLQTLMKPRTSHENPKYDEGGGGGDIFR